MAKERKEESSAAAGTAETVPEERWGTRQMGPPAPPQAHPQNREATQWTPRPSDEQHFQYVLEHTPVQRGASSPMESIMDYFNSWTRSAETMASNMWHNLKTAPSMTDAAWGKLSLATKAISGGGFEPLYKQTFQTLPDERLRKTFACYLSTATGPVAGTLYLSTHNAAFCSDRPLSFRAPSGQESWSYYKVMIPLDKVRDVNPVTLKENPPEKYVQIVTVDGHEFWFMGFVNFDKGVKHMSEAVQRRGAYNGGHHGGQQNNVAAPPPEYVKQPAQAPQHQQPPSNTVNQQQPPNTVNQQQQPYVAQQQTPANMVDQQQPPPYMADQQQPPPYMADQQQQPYMAQQQTPVMKQ